jgi:hypothetical protein
MLSVPLLLFMQSPSSAAPVTHQLPDATMWCGAGYTVDAGSPIFSQIGSATIWLTQSDYAGKWQMVRYDHYLTEGLQYAPVPAETLQSDTDTYLPDPGKSFGLKTGQAQLSCEIISRWAGEDPFTVYGVMTLSRAT